MKELLNYKIEQSIILQLLSFKFDSLPELASKKQSVDWEYIYRESISNRILPIIFKNIKSLKTDSVPDRIFDKFQSTYKEIAKFNFARSTQLIQLVNQIQKNNIPVIAYKGMALAKFAYGDTTLRQFGDIDLFIRKKDFAEVKDLLVGIGCVPAWELTKKQESAVLKNYYEFPFLFGETDTLIELHWAFVESFFYFDYEFDEIWNRTSKIKLYGTKITTLSPEDYMVVLCAHGCKHYWKRLSWICDVGNLIENKKLDWPTIISLASKYGSLRMVWIGVYLAVRIMDIKIPQDISELIRADSKVKLISEKFLNHIFTEEKEPSNWTEMARIHMSMRETKTVKLRYLSRLLTTKTVDSLFLPMGRPR
jgi:hypothetical protein